MSDQDTSTTDVADETTEEQDTTDAEQETSPEDGADEAWDPERAKRKISKVNSENRALRERATKAEEKAASADELEKQNGTLGSENLRLRVGYELGLPLNLALRLQGATREEMLEDAESLVELISPTKRPPSKRPAENLRGGGTSEEPEETDTSKIAERMFRR